MLRVIVMVFMKSDVVLRMYRTGAWYVPSQVGIVLGLMTLFIQNQLVIQMHMTAELLIPDMQMKM